MSTRDWQPFVLAWESREQASMSVTVDWGERNRERIVMTHHVGERQQRRLHLRHVAVLKQVVGFEDVVGLQAVGHDGADEVGQVLQLERKQPI